MGKYIANIVTGSRIVAVVPLLFIPLSSGWFYALYLFCGSTDMIDGTIARKTGAESTFGARLDTVADLVFVLVCAGRILPSICIPSWLWVWISLIATVKVGCIAFALARWKTLVSVHSVLNKVAGGALFLFPLLTAFTDPVYSVVPICLLATVAALREVCCIAKRKDTVL